MKLNVSQLNTFSLSQENVNVVDLACLGGSCHAVVPPEYDTNAWLISSESVWLWGEDNPIALPEDIY